MSRDRSHWAEHDGHASVGHAHAEHGHVDQAAIQAAGNAAVGRIGNGPHWRPEWGPQTGEASFYGTSCDGDKSGDQFAWDRTANGEIMNPDTFIAAHQHLPKGSVVRVTHGDASVVVTVKDRGPYAKDRIMDLSPAAASKIGLIQAGHGQVHLELLKVGDNSYHEPAAADVAKAEEICRVFRHPKHKHKT